MVEIYNGKAVSLTELSLPKSGGSSTEQLDSTTPDVYIEAASVTIGTAVGEHEIVGDDKKIFSEGVRNAVVNLTLKATVMGATQLYEILQAIADYPTSDNCDATTERYYIKMLIKNKAAATVAAFAPATGSWAACEVGDIAFPANDIISVPLTLRYGKLVWAAS